MSKVFELKQELVEKIKNFLSSHNIKSLLAYDVDPGCSPILHEDPYDDDMTFQLDRLTVKDNGTVDVDGSSCYDQRTWKLGTLSCDALEEIVEWLEDNEDIITSLETE